MRYSIYGVIAAAVLFMFALPAFSAEQGEDENNDGFKTEVRPDDENDLNPGLTPLDETVAAGEKVKAGEITIFPLYSIAPENPTANKTVVHEQIQTISLADALETGNFQILDRGPVVINNTGKYVLILAGEILCGGSQNRMAAYDRIIPPVWNKEFYIKVFCVEQNSGARKSASKKKSGDFDCGPKKKRIFGAMKSSSRFDNLANRRMSLLAAVQSFGIDNNSGAQNAIWTEVSEVNGLLKSGNKTDAYRNGLASGPAPSAIAKYVKPLEDAFMADNRITGFACAIDGEVLFADVFAEPALAERYKDRLIKAYVIDALRIKAEDSGGNLEAANLKAAFTKPADAQSKSVDDEGQKTTVTWNDKMLMVETGFGDKFVRRSYYKR